MSDVISDADAVKHQHYDTTCHRQHDTVYNVAACVCIDGERPRTLESHSLRDFEPCPALCV